ncbi:abhydrolase domain-containing protein abhd-5.2, partial [Quercus suber]
ETKGHPINQGDSDAGAVIVVGTAEAGDKSTSWATTGEPLLDTNTNRKKRIAGIDQDELLDPSLLADPDSCFCEFQGVQIHHKIYEFQAPNSLQKNHTLSQLPMILLHGFGASVFSWNRVMKPLAELTGSKVLAFDRPAFGLTSRLNFSSHSSPPATENRRPLNPYSMAFSVLATLYFIDFLAAEKAILVGHSAGSLTAVNSYFEAPERVAALILVAPAILAPLIVHKAAEANQLGRENRMEKDSSDSSSLRNPFLKLSKILLKFAKHVAQAIMQMVKGMAVMLNSLYKKLLSAILRSAFAVMLVRMVIDKFGIAAIRNAWYNSSQVTEHILYVLIVTGDSDRIVPSWNAQRLAQAIPGSHLEVIKHCGHLPHEEKVEEFVSVVEKFVQRVFGEPEKQCLEAVT